MVRRINVRRHIRRLPSGSRTQVIRHRRRLNGSQMAYGETPNIDAVKKAKMESSVYGKEIKIMHQKIHSPSGTVYQRGFNINSTIYSGFLNYLEKTKRKTTDVYDRLYLKQPMEIDGNLRFMNLTQTKEFIKFMDKNKLRYNKKRANIKANGYLIIK